MGTREIANALASLRTTLPWLERVETDVRDDSSGEAALFVRLVVRSGVHGLFDDGERLVDVRRRVRAVLAELGVELWPFIEFVRADELEAV